MAAARRRRWGQRAKWSFCIGAVFAVFGACSSNALDEELSSNAGGGGSSAGGTGPHPTAGKASALPSVGGARPLPSGGRGGTRPNGTGGLGGEEERPRHSDANAGYAGCSIEEQCGGCESAYYVVKCGWGEIEERDYDAEGLDGERACALAQVQAEGGAAGAAGSANAAGAAGASSYPGTCHSYKPRGDVVIGCDSGDCTETFHEDKAGECLIRDECCIVLERMGCGV